MLIHEVRVDGFYIGTEHEVEIAPLQRFVDGIMQWMIFHVE